MASSNFIKSRRIAEHDQNEKNQFYGMVPLTVSLLKNKYIDKLSLDIEGEREPTNTVDDTEYSDRLDIEIKQFELIKPKYGNQDVDDIKNIMKLEEQ